MPRALSVKNFRHTLALGAASYFALSLDFSARVQAAFAQSALPPVNALARNQVDVADEPGAALRRHVLIARLRSKRQMAEDRFAGDS